MGTPNRQFVRQPLAFSLVELLVVISIIALLLAILIPSLSRAKEQARDSVCASHLRSCGELIQSYANAHEDRLAPILWQRDTTWDHPDHLGWDVQVGRWANVEGGADTIWLCGEQRTPFIGNAHALGVDRRWLAAGPDRREFTIVRSRWNDTARLVLAYDVQYNMLDARMIYRHALNPRAADLSDEYHFWPLDEPLTVPFWEPQWGPHHEAFGALFADGHVKVATFTEDNAVIWSGPGWWPDSFRASPVSAGNID